MRRDPGKLKPARTAATYPTLKEAAAGGSLLTGLGAAVLAVGLGGCLDDSKQDASGTDGLPDGNPMIDAQVITDGTPPPPPDAEWLDSDGLAVLDDGPYAPQPDARLSDGLPPYEWLDSAQDAAPPDAGSDAAPPDAGSDAAPPDAGPDAPQSDAPAPPDASGR